MYEVSYAVMIAVYRGIETMNFFYSIPGSA